MLPILSKQDLYEKPIAFQDGTIEQEDLPFPTVLYPGHYGAFFGFKERRRSSIVLCSCAEEAIENSILEIWKKEGFLTSKELLMKMR